LKTVTNVRTSAALICAAAVSGLLPACPAKAQFQQNVYKPSALERAELEAGRNHLRREIGALRDQAHATGKPAEALLPDVEIYLDAVDRNLAQELFFSRQNFEQARQCLRDGEARAAELKGGDAPWTRQTGVVVLGYRSRMDGSAQPYQVYIPADYDFSASPPRRLDLFLHGRGGNLNEIAFIRSPGWVRGNFGASTLPNLALEPYGRGNNGWRFAGETDVFEALADFKRRYHVDDNQTTLRGFSMGGHGVFHIGLHTPGLWAVISPGAGFVDTKQYLGLRSRLPPWEEALLHLYDAVDVAANAKDVPMISYVGALDDKLPQYRLMAEALKRENAPFDEIIAPNTGHRSEPAALADIIAKMAPLRRDPDADVHFVTYTLRYPRCKWITIEGLARHWQRSQVDGSAAGTAITLTTRNISALRLTPSAAMAARVMALRVDGQDVALARRAAQGDIELVRRGGRWRLGAPTGLRKRPGLQGPIDDALYGPLLVVTGTGAAWSSGAEAWSRLELDRFRSSWARYFRGALPEVTDRELKPEDVRGKSLYLFGDPGSNTVLRRLLPKLPLRWTRETIALKGRTFSAADHLPLFVYPNPESSGHYIVVDTGMTFSRADQEGSNALQYPHLPDYAVVRIDPSHFTDDRRTDTEMAGFFDESWR
jgi:predicted esterase